MKSVMGIHTEPTNEEFYDSEIAPKLLELANQCGDRGMSFVSVVEYAPGERSTTKRLMTDAGLAMVMLAHCAKMGENVDGYIMGLMRYCREKSIDISASIILSKFTG